MALTKAILDTTPHSITYSLTEDGNAAAELAIDVGTDCEAGPLKTLLATAVADQAAARVLIEDNVDVIVHQRTGLATLPQNLALDYDDNATVFEMNALSHKANNTDTAVWIVKLVYRHSLTK